MDRGLVRSEATNLGQSTLSRSFNDLNTVGQDLRAAKASLVAALSLPGHAKEKYSASFPDIGSVPKKITSSGTRKDEHLVTDQSSYDFPKLNLIPNQIEHGRTQLTRPRSCTARVHSTSPATRTPEMLRRHRMPRPSLPVAIEIGKTHSAPSSPNLSKKSLGISKSSSFTSPRSGHVVVEETVDFVVNFRRKSYDVGFVSPSPLPTPPVSPALLRKFEHSEKTARKAKNQIDDYKRSSPIQQSREQVEGKSLAEALEEVKNCRYLRVVNRK